ncbi:MAG: hypothetical protein GXO87_09855 [Chlorobi bacterium]|nr:hypothetical protein [Chlorobiota bacterium]
MKKPVQFAFVIFRDLTIGFLCLFFAGFANVTYKYFQTDQENSRLYCCCAGEMVEECNCSGGCCSSENDFSLSLTKRSCGESKILKTVSIELMFTFCLFEYPNAFPNRYKPINGYDFSKYLPYISTIDKPPQNSFVI